MDVQSPVLDAVPGALLLSTAAGICSGIGGVAAIAISGTHMGLERLALWQGAIGALLLFFGGFDILPEAAAGISVWRAITFFCFGFVGMWSVGRLVRVLWGGWGGGIGGEMGGCGYVIFACLSLHNLLEGISICLAAHEGIDKGLGLATAVGFENIPEGVAISLPLYYATGRKGMAVRLAFLSGLMEPVGVLFAGVFLRSSLTQRLISSLLAMVAGIMVYASLIEMLPVALKNIGSPRLAVLSAWLGVGVLSASLVQPLLMYHGRVGSVS